MIRFSSPLIITIEKYSVSLGAQPSDSATLAYDLHTDYTGHAVDGLRLLGCTFVADALLTGTLIYILLHSRTGFKR